MSKAWSITPKKIEDAIRRIVKLGQPRKVILFGSVAQGKINKDSDVDLLVVTDNNVESPRKESVRLRRALRGISMPIDILVVPEKRLEELAEQPGLIYREVLQHGKVVYEAPE
ncbi:nucleotidyltransferase domain-containing protein [Acidobacteria bacterium AH-259-O06]|nr:nucleotidyltransferase domain-containing protein [Acidobacteria bacterium AH-259-G07]MDA2930795.1 nucleotidyltransferase domain-containing protein [Acidobacteria bacterium AH-259-O06]